MRKTILNICFLTVTIVLVKLAFIAFDYLTENESKQIPDGKVYPDHSVIKDFKEAALKVNETCPKMLDGDLRLDRAFVGPDLRLTMKHTLINFKADEVDLDAFMDIYYNGKKHQFCEIYKSDKPIFHHGIFTYEFYGNKGKLITSFDLRMSDCLN